MANKPPGVALWAMPCQPQACATTIGVWIATAIAAPRYTGRASSSAAPSNAVAASSAQTYQPFTASIGNGDQTSVTVDHAGNASSAHKRLPSNWSW